MPLVDGSDSDAIKIMAAWIRYFFHNDPYALEPEEFATQWQEASYLMQKIKPIKPDESRI